MMRRLHLFRILATILIFTCSSIVAFGYDATVAKDGSGDFTTVQAALNAAPTGRTTPWIIFIKNGVYYEKDTVPSNKPFMQLVGESVSGTIITFNAGAEVARPGGGGTYGTLGSATFTINATDFSAMNITFVNSYGDGTQAVAVAASNDRATFCNCRFLGNQDTLYTRGSGTPKQYFRNCYIDGNVDFIFGNAIAVFDSCVIYAKTRSNAGSSYITAANTPPGQAYGMVFRNCRLPANRGLTTYYLGRPWQNSNGSTIPYANNKTVFINAKMSSSIRPEGWSAWDAGTDVSLITYAEYQTTYFNGTPVDISQRVPWSKQLTLGDLVAYDLNTIFSGWDPLAILGGACNSSPDLAVNNLKGVKGASNTDITWNASWPIPGVLYELFRSVDGGPFSSIGSQITTTDSTINFGSMDAIPPPGGIYKYYVRASKASYTTAISDTITVSSAPTLVVTGALGAFVQGLGTPSTAQSYSISGYDLLGNVTITPPVGYEVSGDDGATWFTNASPLVIVPGGAIMASKVIKVRLNASSLADWAGNIINSTIGPGNMPVSVAVTGKTLTALPDPAVVLHHWPFSQNSQDSAAIRSIGVLPSSSTLHNLYVSNGTTSATYQPYSENWGQAFGASTDGSGQWSTGAGGPGGNLNRNYYEEFTVTAAPDKTVRVDSIIFKTAFLLTTSGIKMAVVYSKTGFVSDSADVSGGIGPSGTLPGSGNGGFTTPIALNRQDGGPTDVYRLALQGATGIKIEDGQTLTIRLYYACSSTGTPRYAFLKDVIVNGALITSAKVLQQWPLNFNNQDSAAVRSTSLVATTPVFNNLYLSNGTTNTFYQPYSTSHGQAFGASPDGSGQWSTGVGGPGGNMSRIYYEEFKVTTATGKGVRLDSLILNASFLLTNSNTKLAVVYSKTGFVSDSANITGGYGPAGLLAPGANGAFATPIILNRQDTGPTDKYSLAFNAENGVLIADGETLTFRLYYACGSTGVPRYTFLKNVIIKGVTTGVVLPVKLLSFNGVLAASKSNLWWNTSNEVTLSHFEVEKSLDASHFMKTGSVEAYNSTTNNAYSFQDNLGIDINNGRKMFYYRLKMVDRDGKYSYSQVIPLFMAGNSGKLLVYPNPVRGQINLVHERATNRSSIRILAADGRELIRMIPSMGAGQSQVNTATLPPGTYMLLFENDGQKIFSKFVKD